MRNKLQIYHKDEMVCTKHMDKSTSKSPTKPILVLNELKKILPNTLYNIVNFNPFNKNDFEIAHTKEYVDLVYNFNKPGSFLPSSIPWSIELVKSLELTNASLYNAIKNSIINPDNLHFSNTSGFHHARPKAGSGFCTFAGQVISSVKIYRELGKVGCYLDLDGHYGNSIEDCRDYVSDLDKAVPKGFNFNPTGYNQVYAKMLEQFLYGKLEHAILNGKVDYVVWCHGADSHEDDDLGGQVNTKYWKECSVIFWDWVKYMDEQLGRPLPVSFALFGGYRKDSYESVISLHISDIVTGINTMTDANIEYELNYKPTKNKNYYGRH